MNDNSNPQNDISIDWNKATNRLVLIVGIGILVSVLFNFFFTGKLQLKELLDFTPLSLIIAFFLAVSPWMAHAVEIIIWTNFFKNRVNFKEALRISIATDLGSAITPTMVGGAPIKLGMLMKKGLSSGQAGAMVIFTGIEDLVFFLIMISLSIIYSDTIGIGIVHKIVEKLSGELSTKLYIGGSFLLVGLVVWLIFKKYSLGERLRAKIRASLADFKLAMKMIVKDGKTAFLLATIAICARWVTRFFILVALVKGIGAVANYKEIYLSEWLVYMGMTVTPTPGAIGGAEGSFKLVYEHLIPSEVFAPVMVAWRFFNYFLLLILSALFLNFTNKWRKAK